MITTKANAQRFLYLYSYREQVNKAGWVTTANASSYDFTHTDTFSGTTLPGFQLLCRLKQNATTVASGGRYHAFFGRGSCYAAFQTNTQFVERSVEGDYAPQYLLPLPGGDAPLAASVYNTGLTRFLKKCLSMQQQLQGGTFLGEIGQTIRLIRHPFAALENATRDYLYRCKRHSLRLNPRVLPKAIIDEYLAYRFGALPLFSDIEGIINGLLRLRDLANVVKTRAYNEEEKIFDTQVFSTTQNGIPLIVSRERGIRNSILFRGAVKIASVGPGPPILEAAGLTYRDFIPTAYNLIPYSFLLDYVSNVGDILECCSFYLSDLPWHCTTQRSVQFSRVTISPSRPATLFGWPCVGYSVEPIRCQLESKIFQRDGAELGLPNLAFKVPTPVQLWNVAALAGSATLSGSGRNFIR